MGAYIAFQVFGSGPIDVLLIPGSSRTSMRTGGSLARGYAPTDRGIRAGIAMDRRGVGLSDRLSPGHAAPLETHVDDLVAVLDATSARDVCLVTSESGSPLLALLFAAAHPERVRALALYSRVKVSPLFSLGIQDASAPELVYWGSDSFVRRDLEGAAPSVAGDPAAVRAWGGYLRAAASPGSAFAMYQQWWENEIRDILPTVRAPTSDPDSPRRGLHRSDTRRS